MGAFCSKAGTHEGGHQVIGTTQKLGGEGVKGDPAKAGLEAAEKRKKEEQRRGTNSNNPNAGKLSDQLSAARKASKEPEGRQPEGRLVWD